MMQRIAVLTCAVLLVAAGAFAQVADDVKGTVAYVDLGAKTITFTDGRIMHYDPRSVIMVDGKVVTLGEVRPGTAIALRPAPATAVVVPGPPQQAVAVSPPVVSHPPVDVSGRVASVDRQNGIITFQDGRMVRVMPNGRMYQSVGLASIQPGSDVLVGDALPIGFRGTGSTMIGTPSAWTDRDMMGRVTSIDSSGGQIILSDGTILAVGPSTRMQMWNGQVVTINDLRPGDEVVVRVRQAPAAVAVPTAPVVTGDVRSPGFRGYRAALDTDYVVIVRRPESP